MRKVYSLAPKVLHLQSRRAASLGYRLYFLLSASERGYAHCCLGFTHMYGNPCHCFYSRSKVAATAPASLMLRLSAKPDSRLTGTSTFPSGCGSLGGDELDTKLPRFVSGASVQ